MGRLKRIFIKSLNGCVYVESYNGKHNEEKDRAKIYDSNHNYIDYISLDGLTKKRYLQLIKYIKESENIVAFILNTTGATSYDLSKNLSDLLYSTVESDQDTETLAELETDLEALSETELLNKYMINRVGDYYFYIGEY